jgi:hypothetical protein
MNSDASPFVGFASFSTPFLRDLRFAISWLRPYHLSPGFYDSRGAQTLDPVVAYYEGGALGNHFMEDNLIGSIAAPLNSDKSLCLGFNFRSLYSASNATLSRELPNNVKAPTNIFGYGLDIGILYRLLLTQFGREVSFGFMTQNLGTRVKYTDTNVEVPWPNLVRLGTAYQDRDFLFDSRLYLATDVEINADPQFGGNENKKWHLGLEEWFLHDRVGFRGGYVSPLYTSGQYSLGVSLYIFQGVRLDYAAVLGNNGQFVDQTHWFTALVRWAPSREPIAVLPKISISAKPDSFNPVEQQITEFSLKAYDETGIKNWMVTIADSNNVVVKTFSDVGHHPPDLVQWDGKDREGYFVADGEYVFTLAATNYIRGTSVTPLSRLRVIVPPKRMERKSDISQLQVLLAEEQNIETRNRQAAVDRAKKDLTNMLKVIAVPPTLTFTQTYVPTLTPTPRDTPVFRRIIETPTLTPTPPFQLGNAGVQQVLNVYMAEPSQGGKVFVVDYQTSQYEVRSLLREMERVTKILAKDVGTSVNSYSMRAHYSGNVLTADTSAEIARRLEAGQITTQQWLNSSYVTMNGKRVQPTVD